MDMHRHAVRSVVCLALVLGVFACGTPDNPPPPPPEDPGNARFTVRESVQQLQITHADPGAMLAVFDAQGQMAQSGTADKLGSLMLRKLTPGAGYVVRVVGSSPVEYSRQLTVMSVENSAPAQTFYSGQKLMPGFGYIKTRDGTPLSAYVTLPGPPENGPYPTVVAYSGYNASQPGAPVSGVEFLCPQFPTLCDAPNDPSALLISLFGYATVSVNMRGTGCSGGAYDYFETLQDLDGYDVIETVAAQDWVQFHKVGMTGISYPAIAQLFTAWQKPPSLAAITPLSVIGNTATTLEPGGILNSGFALQWVTQVLDRADPYGQGWEKAQVDTGDMVCAENQLLHGQKVDNVAEAGMQAFYIPEIADPLNPTFFAPELEVPIFLAGAWEDEQTGPFFTTLFNRFTKSPLTRFTVYNGIHEDGFQPAVMAEWVNFLDLYVAKKIPQIDSQLRSLAPLLFKQVYGSELNFPPDRFGGYTTYEDALAAYQKEPIVRVLFENGGGDNTDPGAPLTRYEKSFPVWPPAETTPLRFYFHTDGSLSETAPTEAATASSFKLDPDAGQRGNLASDGDVTAKLPHYDYQPLVADHAMAFETPPLTADLALVGTASADLWLRSTVDDADLQVVITEVRPDGNEMYVQAGWLRASHRALGSDSTPLWPSPTYLEKDNLPLVPGQWVQARVPIPGMGHVFRAGSRVRVSVDTPGGTRPAWRFTLKTFAGDVTHTIGHSMAYPSSILLPELAPGTITAAPNVSACPSLRGQPCRTYVPYVNTPATMP